MNRKPIIKVILSKEQKDILDKLANRLGVSQSELMRTAFMEYAKSLNIVSEHVKNPSLFGSYSKPER